MVLNWSITTSSFSGVFASGTKTGNGLNLAAFNRDMRREDLSLISP